MAGSIIPLLLVAGGAAVAISSGKKKKKKKEAIGKDTFPDTDPPKPDPLNPDGGAEINIFLSATENPVDRRVFLQEGDILNVIHSHGPGGTPFVTSLEISDGTELDVLGSEKVSEDTGKMPAPGDPASDTLVKIKAMSAGNAEIRLVNKSLADGSTDVISKVEVSVAQQRDQELTLHDSGAIRGIEYRVMKIDGGGGDFAYIGEIALPDYGGTFQPAHYDFKDNAEDAKLLASEAIAVFIAEKAAQEEAETPSGFVEGLSGDIQGIPYRVAFEGFPRNAVYFGEVSFPEDSGEFKRITDAMDAGDKAALLAQEAIGIYLAEQAEKNGSATSVEEKQAEDIPTPEES